MKPFEPAYSQEALAALLAAGATRRKLAARVIDRLCRFPERLGDCPIPGPDGRDNQVLLRDGLLLTYWIDDAAREVRIVNIEWTS